MPDQALLDDIAAVEDASNNGRGAAGPDVALLADISAVERGHAGRAPTGVDPILWADIQTVEQTPDAGMPAELPALPDGLTWTAQGRIRLPATSSGLAEEITPAELLLRIDQAQGRQETQQSRATTAAARLRDQLPGGSLAPVRALAVGLGQGGADVASMLARVLGMRDPHMADQADALAHLAGDAERAAAVADSDSMLPAALLRAGRGATRSLSTMVPMGAVRGVPAVASMIGGAAAVRGNQAITEARDAGLSASAAAGYVGRAATIEAVPAMIMQRLGLGGLESTLAGQVMRGGMRQAITHAGFDALKELPEELVTEISDNINQVLSAVDPQALTADALQQTVLDTTLQTLLTVGVANTPGIVQAGVDARQERRAGQQRQLRDALHRLQTPQPSGGLSLPPSDTPGDGLRVVGRTDAGRPIFDVSPPAAPPSADAPLLADIQAVEAMGSADTPAPGDQGTPTAAPSAPPTPRAEDLVARHRVVAAELQRWQDRIALAANGTDRQAGPVARKHAAQTRKLLLSIEDRMTPEERASVRQPAMEVPDVQATPTVERPAGAVPGAASPATGTTTAPQASIAPEPQGWQRFAPETGTLNVPRAQMPQIDSDKRGALSNFLRARGISWDMEEVDPSTLKPTQAEWSPQKVAKARKSLANTGDQARAILVSSDGHVIDGHHQAMAAQDAGQPIKVIRIGAPIREALAAISAFPSTRKDAAPTPVASGEPETKPVVSGEKASDAKQGSPTEPWQMTRAEWGRAISEIGPQYLGWNGGSGKSVTADKVEARTAAKRRLRMDLPDKPREPDALSADPADHADVVREAIRRGLPVPQHVLAEYPEIQRTGEGQGDGERLSGPDRIPGDPEPAGASALPPGTAAISPDQVPAGFNTAGRGDPQAQRFVLAPGGGLDWGAIDAEVAAAIGRQAGPIRLQVGWHGGEGAGFGLVHLRLAGKKGGMDPQFLQDVLHHYDEIHQAGGRLILVRSKAGKRHDAVFVELVPGDHYSVITSYGIRTTHLQDSVPLWPRSRYPRNASRPETPGLPDSTREGRDGPPKAAQQSEDGGIVTTSSETGKQQTAESMAPDQSRSSTRTRAPRPETPGLPVTAIKGRSGPPKAAQQTGTTGIVPPSRTSDKRPPDDKMFQVDRIPGEPGQPATAERMQMPDPAEGIESLIGWALRDRAATIAKMRERIARGGSMVEEYQQVLAEHEGVSEDALAKDMLEYPQHYIRLMSDRGGNMAPVGVYRRRLEMPPQQPRVQVGALAPEGDDLAPDLRATLQKLRDDLRRVSPAAPTLSVDKGLPEGSGGEFDTRTGGIRTRHHNDLDLVGHEVGHWVGVTYGLMPAASDTETRAELARFAIHGSPAKGENVMHEGMAEYLRAWMVDPAEAETRAPRFAAQMRAHLPAPVAMALRAYGDAVRRFAGASALEQMAAGAERTTTALAREQREGHWYAPMVRAIETKWGIGTGPKPGRTGALPTTWTASVGDKVLFHISDKEAPQLTNYYTSLLLVGKDPATMLPSEHWDVLRQAQRGVNGKIRDGVSRWGLPNIDGTAALDPVTGEPMAVPWLLGPTMDLSEDQFGVFLDRAHAYGSAQRTIELADRFTAKAEQEISAFTERQMATVGQDRWRQRSAAKAVEQFAAERRRQLRAQLARITAAGGGITSATETARRAVAEMAQDPQRAQIEEYLRRYRAWADWNLSYAVATELMSPSQAETIRQANQFYIDWHRVFADDEGPVHLGEAVSGSSRTMHNPLASLLHATWGTINRGDRNRAMLAFVAPLRERPTGGGKALAALGDQISDEDATAASTRQHGYHEHNGVRKRVYAVQRVVQEIAEDGSPLTGPNGEPMQSVQTEHWVFDPATEASMEAMRADSDNNLWVNFTQGLVNLQRLMITSAPGFRFKVPVRDNIERLLNTATGSGFIDIVRGSQRYFADPLTGEPVDMERLYSQSGASMAGWNRRTREQALADVLGYVADTRARGWKWMTPGGMLRAWESFGEKSENLARKAEFLAAFRKARVEFGYGQLDASLYAMTQARGLLDTAESGYTVAQLNRFFLFLNAAVKAVERTTKITRAAAAAYRRGDTTTGNRLAMSMAARVAVWGTTLYAMRMLVLAMSDDDEQESLLTAPAWKRDFAFILPDIGLGRIAIPKPYEWGFLGSGFERLADATWASHRAAQARAAGRDEDARRWHEHARRSHEGWGSSGITALLPLKFDDVLGGGLAPVAEVAFNRSLFTGGPIIPAHEVDKKLELRDRAADASLVGRGISAVAAPLVGDRFGDPRAVDHLLRGYLGGWGTTATAKDWSEVLRRFSGYSGETSPYSERDVRWVLDWAASNGHASKKPFASLRAMAKAARDAPSEQRRNRLETLRRNAAFLRRGIERQEQRAGTTGN